MTRVQDLSFTVSFKGFSYLEKNFLLSFTACDSFLLQCSLYVIDLTSILSNFQCSISSMKKNQGKIPKKIQKSEREKKKRNHLNDLFSELEYALGQLLFPETLSLIFLSQLCLVHPH